MERRLLFPMRRLLRLCLETSRPRIRVRGFFISGDRKYFANKLIYCIMQSLINNEEAEMKYHRYTSAPYCAPVGLHAMFAASQEQVETCYGSNHWTVDSDNLVIIDAASEEFRAAVTAAWQHSQPEDCADLDEFLAYCAPEWIVDYAGVWDDPQAAEWLWENVLSGMSAQAVLTPDGLILLDTSLAVREA